jgi:hypothetical protein
VHTVKTRALARLIPHGSEGLYTLSQIYDAHLYVLRHHLDLDRETVQAVLVDEFISIARDTKQYHLSSIFQDRLDDLPEKILKRIP